MNSPTANSTKVRASYEPAPLVIDADDRSTFVPGRFKQPALLVNPAASPEQLWGLIEGRLEMLQEHLNLMACLPPDIEVNVNQFVNPLLAQIQTALELAKVANSRVQHLAVTTLKTGPASH